MLVLLQSSSRYSASGGVALVAPGAGRRQYVVAWITALRARFLQIDAGVDVVSADGERVGKLEYVLADEQTAIFDGIVIDVARGPGGHRFVDAPEVLEFRERAVLLALPAGAVDELPTPSANPAVIQHGGVEDSESELVQKLRRAWDLISGRY